MSNKPATKSDREIFFESLRLFDRSASELRQRPLEHDVDTDAFVDRAFGNLTLPPQ